MEVDICIADRTDWLRQKDMSIDRVLLRNIITWRVRYGIANTKSTLRYITGYHGMLFISVHYYDAEEKDPFTRIIRGPMLI